MPLCKRCGNAISTAAAAGGRVTCASCGATFAVLKPVPAREPLFDDDDFFAPAPVQKPPAEEIVKKPAPDVDPNRLLENRLRSEHIEEPLPRWTFFSGVFSFPFYSTALPRWVGLSVGLALFGLLDALIRYAIGEGGMMLVATGLPMVGVGTVVTLLFGYAGKLFWAIVNGTGDGQDQIVDWGEANWKEWIWPLLWLAYLFFASLAAGYGVCQLLETDSRQPMVVSVWLLFPIILLSSIDTNSPFGLLSWPILRSWRTCRWAWLTFYAVSALLLDGYYWADQWSQGWIVPNIIVNGPILAAVVFIYGRLIGRLAWAAGMSGAWDDPADQARPFAEA